MNPLTLGIGFVLKGLFKQAAPMGAVNPMVRFRDPATTDVLPGGLDTVPTLPPQPPPSLASELAQGAVMGGVGGAAAPIAASAVAPATDWDARFRTETGTRFNPQSPQDVANMPALKARGENYAPTGATTVNTAQFRQGARPGLAGIGGMRHKRASALGLALTIVDFDWTLKSAATAPTDLPFGPAAPVGRAVISGAGDMLHGAKAAPNPGMWQRLLGSLRKGGGGRGKLLAGIGMAGAGMLGNMFGGRGKTQAVDSAARGGIGQGVQFAQQQYGNRGFLDRLMNNDPESITKLLSMLQGGATGAPAAAPAA